MNSRRVFEGFRQNGDHFGYFFDTLGGVGLATVFFIPPPRRDFGAKCIQLGWSEISPEVVFVL